MCVPCTNWLEFFRLFVSSNLVLMLLSFYLSQYQLATNIFSLKFTNVCLVQDDIKVPVNSVLPNYDSYLSSKH